MLRKIKKPPSGLLRRGRERTPAGSELAATRQLSVRQERHHVRISNLLLHWSPACWRRPVGTMGPGCWLVPPGSQPRIRQLTVLRGRTALLPLLPEGLRRGLTGPGGGPSRGWLRVFWHIRGVRARGGLHRAASGP